jgi:hypothetical protein
MTEVRNKKQTMCEKVRSRQLRAQSDVRRSKTLAMWGSGGNSVCNVKPVYNGNQVHSYIFSIQTGFCLVRVVPGVRLDKQKLTLLSITQIASKKFMVRM